MKTVILSLLLCCSTLIQGAEKFIIKGLFKDKAVIEMSGKVTILTVGKAKNGLLLISADTKQAVIEHDGERHSYALGTHIGSSYTAAEKGTSMRIWPTPQGMYEVNGSINSFPMRFLVDTGATTVAMNSQQAKRIGLNYKMNSQIGSAVTASGVVKAYYLKLDKVRIGEIELRDIPASVIEGSHPTEVLLGQSFLNQLIMRRDGQMMELITK